MRERSRPGASARGRRNGEDAPLVARRVGADKPGTGRARARRPDGPPQKLLDVSRLTALGWQPKIPLREGLAAAYADFLQGSRRTAA